MKKQQLHVNASSKTALLPYVTEIICCWNLAS